MAASESDAKHVLIHYDPTLHALRIKNSGPLIPQEKAKLIFEPFYTKRKQQSTGLGLTSAQATFKYHGGTILYEPVNNETSFSLYFP